MDFYVSFCKVSTEPFRFLFIFSVVGSSFTVLDLFVIPI